MKVLVTGAGGYIGSVVTEQLVEQGHDVVALDSLLHGFRAAVDPRAHFVQGDLRDGSWLASLLSRSPVDAVVHLAAEALIAESMTDPGRFFTANVIGGLNLLEAMTASGVRRIVFSSTAAVYGEPVSIPIVESAPHAPINSYGESKLAFERMLEWYRRAGRLKYVALRYFNACGATTRCGESHRPETHLIPILLEVALGQRDGIRLFGTDYDTPDGTCIRDYIHVSDIAQAHLLALREVYRIGGQAFNMGNGAGYSNLEVVNTVRRVTGRDIPVAAEGRRPGDPARLIASHDRIRAELGWTPRYPGLGEMVETAWAWRLDHPKGYEA